MTYPTATPALAPSAATPAAPAASKTVLVLGANGRFGQAAVQAFAAAGWLVLAQARRPLDYPLPTGVRHLASGLADVAVQAAGAAVVVHAINPIYTDWAEQAVPLTRAGMDIARSLGALFMLPGNVYNFGEHMPALLTEDTPQQPTNDKGRLRCAIEAEMQARGAQGLRSVVIRAGDFFGSGSGSWLDLVIAKSLAGGKLVYPGPTDVAHAWAYLPDLARAFVGVAAAASKPDAPAFQRLHFAGHTLTGAALLAAIEAAAATIGARPATGIKHGAMPWWLLRLGGRVVPMWRAIAEMSYLWRVPHALDGTALARVVGPLRRTPIEAALRQALLDLGFGHAAPVLASAPMA